MVTIFIIKIGEKAKGAGLYSQIILSPLNSPLNKGGKAKPWGDK